MGSQGGEDLQQGCSWRTQRGGGLWNGAGHAAASRPQRWWLADPEARHSRIDKLGGRVGSKAGRATQGSSAGK